MPLIRVWIQVVLERDNFHFCSIFVTVFISNHFIICQQLIDYFKCQYVLKSAGKLNFLK